MQGSAGWNQHPLEPALETQLPSVVLERLPEWRRQWDEIWYVELNGNVYVFRAPTRGEAIKHDLNVVSTPGYGAKEFVDCCLLYPEELEDVQLAEFDGLYRAIWVASGFKNAEVFAERLAQFEQMIQSPDHQVVNELMMAFSDLTPDVINSWQPEKLTYMYACARFKLMLASGQQPEPSQQEATPPPRTFGEGRSFHDWVGDQKEMDAFERF